MDKEGLINSIRSTYYNAVDRASSGPVSPVNNGVNCPCHDETEIRDLAHAEEQRNARRKLILAAILCFFFMVGEVVGGAFAHSLAIMTDAAHLLMDFTSFGISLLALYLSSKPPSKRLNFGWHRAEILGALLSVLLIWVVTGILVFLAIERCRHMNFEIDGKIMLITSAVGVVVNILMATTLYQYEQSHSTGGHGHSHFGISHSHSHGSDNHSHGGDAEANTADDKNGHKPENLNVRAAFIHVIGDLLQSIGVLIASIIIFIEPKYKIADPICTFLFSFLVLITTVNIIKDTLLVLMEATPPGMDVRKVKDALSTLSGVVEIHDLRVWSLTLSKTVMTVHLAVDPHEKGRDILSAASTMVRKRFNVHSVTIQLEDYVDQMADCNHCQTPEN